MDLRVGKVYRIGRKLGKGSFGDIFLGTHVDTSEEVAIKLERRNTSQPQLLREAKIYRVLKGLVGIPNCRWFGVEGDFNVLVMDVLSKSLENLFDDCGRKFSLKTVCMLAEQIISRIEVIHTKSFIHRDIKPDNFLMGKGPRRNTVYVIDFGLSKLYRDPTTRRHIPFREGKSIIGTVRYASIYNHLGFEQSRRDDLISIGYMLMYFIRGSLPWQGLYANTKSHKYQRIYECKKDTSVETLCANSPDELRQYFEHVNTLAFEDRPNYPFLKGLFAEIMLKNNWTNDGVFDWDELSNDAKDGSSRGGERALGTPSVLSVQQGEDEAEDLMSNYEDEDGDAGDAKVSGSSAAKSDAKLSNTPLSPPKERPALNKTLSKSSAIARK